MKRLLIDCAMFVVVSSTMSCALLSAAPAPVDKVARKHHKLITYSYVLNYNDSIWQVVLYEDGTYHATRKDCTPWSGRWYGEIAAGTIYVEEWQGDKKPDNPLRWEARQTTPGNLFLQRK